MESKPRERYWNYRVLHDVEQGDWWIGEVHYDDDVPIMYSEASSVYGESLRECRADLENHALALAKPALEVNDGRISEIESSD